MGGKIKIIFVDSDECYLNHLEYYFMLHYSQRFDIYSFSSTERLTDFLKNSMTIVDIMMIGSLCIDNKFLLNKAKSVIKLTENEIGAEEGDTVYKYKHTELLIKDILDIYSKNCVNNTSSAKRKKTLIVTVVSSMGGCGKSSIAIGLSILACRRGLKALYLNLEDIPSTGAYLKGVSDRNLSDLIYYLKEKDSSFSMKIEGICCYDPVSELNYFLPPDSAAQMDELFMDDLEKLVDTLRYVSLYNVVFIDLAGRISPKELYIMRACDTIVRVSMQGFSMPAKEETFDRALLYAEGPNYNDLVAKTINVLNRYQMERCDSLFDMNRYKFVIKESEKLRLYNGERTLVEMDPSFTATLGGLLDEVVSEDKIISAGSSGGNNG